MRFVIPSAGRAATHTTARLLSGLDYVYLLHDAAEAAEYRHHAGETGLDPARIVVTGQPRTVGGRALGLNRQRAYALRGLLDRGEWFCFMDDDIRKLTALPEQYRRGRPLPTLPGPALQALYDTDTGPDGWVTVLLEMRAEAERVGATLCGMSPTRNHFFRGRRFRYVGYVEGSLMLCKNDRPDLYPDDITMEDFAYTAAHLREYGVVLLDNFAFPLNTHYIAGGLGPAKGRAADRSLDCQLLLDRYPGLFRRKAPGVDDLRVRFTTPAQVARWRGEMEARQWGK